MVLGVSHKDSRNCDALYLPIISSICYGICFRVKPMQHLSDRYIRAASRKMGILFSRQLPLTIDLFIIRNLGLALRKFPQEN
ncbi:unnamed protein product [Trifolium pratense]|uniref:Uncharacterized protein n=1 Tax=Trifolium pratense TaxID=57577 RepID=A0ACB0LWZ9_TRIPR|nr:unnamed protein product [Trifolium pratense]